MSNSDLHFDVPLTILVGTIAISLLVFFLISFFFAYNKRQHQYLQEKALLKSQFDSEILKSQIEVQNSTLQTIGEELHDNIGQLLSVAKLNLNILEDSVKTTQHKDYIKQTNEIIGQCIHDLRALTKSLDGDFIEQFGLQESIAFELQRVRKIKKFETEISIAGDIFSLGYEKEIVLFRIFQEFLNNSIKHSEAKNIKVKLTYFTDHLNVIFSDDGKGFHFENVPTEKLDCSGAGLRNIQRRCTLIGAQCNMNSSKGHGTRLEMKIPYTQENILVINPIVY